MIFASPVYPRTVGIEPEVENEIIFALFVHFQTCL